MFARLVPLCLLAGCALAGGDGSIAGLRVDDENRWRVDGGPDAVGPPRPGADVDADLDGVSDADEGFPVRDSDADGIPDFEDADSDNDGITDAAEAGDGDLATAPQDRDGDGMPDFQDVDADGNGVTDAVEGTADADGDGTPDYTDLDDDGDGLLDTVEVGADPVAPLDSDLDGTPDYRDLDADGDAITDHDEALGAPDLDGDGVMAYLDADADGDCREDRLEAGDLDVATPARDTDDDGTADYLDLDSDGDGVRDHDEDLDCDGARGGVESDALLADTDGDGATDLVEHAAGTLPADAASNPASAGLLVFLAPYAVTAPPESQSLQFETELTKADVFFVMDTTGSMSGEIGELKSWISEGIATIRDRIPNVAIGVGGYEDFADTSACYGASTDRPFYLLHRVMTVGTAAGLASVQAAVNTLAVRGGGDVPESGWQAMHEIATGDGISFGYTTTPAFSTISSPPTSVPGGESVGTIGGVGFRAGALPIVIWLTDSYNHNSEGYASAAYGSASCPAIPAAAHRSTATAELVGLGARLVAVVSNDVYYADAKNDCGYAVNATGTTVGPEAWGTPASGRPASCAAGMCCTGANGYGEPTDAAGRCALLFTIASTGAGLGEAITKAITVLSSNGRFDVGARVDDVPGDGVNAVAAFVDRIEAHPAGSIGCSVGLSATDSDGNGSLDTFLDVLPGSTVCFDLVPAPNTTVAAGAVAQVFHAQVVVLGDGVAALATRPVTFVVPPAP